MLGFNQKKELRAKGREQAIDGLLRSQFSDAETNSGSNAIAKLRQDQIALSINENHKKSNRISPYSSGIHNNVEKPPRLALAIIMGSAFPIAAAFLIFFIGEWQKAPKAMAGNPFISNFSQNISLKRQNKEIDNNQSTELLTNDILNIPFGGHAQITYTDGTKIDLLENTRITFALKEGTEFDIKNQKHLKLISGTISMDVAKQTNAHPLLIQTKNAQVKVLGTKFELEANASETKLEMKEGLVQLKDLQTTESIHVREDEYAVVKRGVTLKAQKKIHLSSILRQEKEVLVKYSFQENFLKGNSFINLASNQKPLPLKYPEDPRSKLSQGPGLKISKATSLTNNKDAITPIQKIKDQNALSLEVWIKPEAIKDQTDHALIFSSGKHKNLFGQAEWLFFLGQKNDKIIFTLKTDDPDEWDKTFETQSILSTTEASHIVISKNDLGEVTIYHNGIAVLKDTIKGSLKAWDLNDGKISLNLIGNKSASYEWKGTIYFASLFARTLSPAEVQNNFLANYPK